MRESDRVRARESVRGKLRARGYNQHYSTIQRSSPDYYKGSTSYYFTNFPDNHDLEDMWKLFLRWGRVIDVFIPQKRDKFGKRFGFVKFLEVKNPKALEEQLDSLWIGSYKLRVNIPAFDRGAVKSKVVKPQVINGTFN